MALHAVGELGVGSLPTFFSFVMISCLSLWAAPARRPQLLCHYPLVVPVSSPPAYLVIRIIYSSIDTFQSITACYLFDSDGQQMKT